jgi:NAD(P)-dependent dehydrogenase (short-subunit alcohol dehydrogenase family)
MKAVLTGHSRGLGAAILDALQARGVPVLALARSRCDLPRDGSGITQVCLDLGDPQALIDWLAGDTLRTFLAGCDRVLLINNAGTLGPVHPLGAQGAERIAPALALDIAAPLMLADALVAASPQARERRILHVSSGAAQTPYAGWSIYCASKAALDQHARAAALDAPAGTRIVSLAPGVVDTAMQAEIRATPVENFPQKTRFEALARDGQLSSPADCARRLLDYMLSEAFGAQPVVNLRDIPGR